MLSPTFSQLRNHLASAVVVAALAVGLASLAGCGRWLAGGSPMMDEPPIANPLPLPPVPRELVMDEVSDEIDDYFRIAVEQRIQLVDNVMSEGWIETHPRVGSTLLEPWRRDSTPGFERLHATLQSVRRTARVRVIPTGDGYLVDLQVFKELEDLVQPEGAAVTGRQLRFDNSLDADRPDYISGPFNRGWIPMGRDLSLENQILANIQARIESAVESPH